MWLNHTHNRAAIDVIGIVECPAIMPILGDNFCGNRTRVEARLSGCCIPDGGLYNPARSDDACLAGHNRDIPVWYSWTVQPVLALLPLPKTVVILQLSFFPPSPHLYGPYYGSCFFAGYTRGVGLLE